MISLCKREKEKKKAEEGKGWRFQLELLSFSLLISKILCSFSFCVPADWTCMGVCLSLLCYQGVMHRVDRGSIDVCTRVLVTFAAVT